MVVDFLLQQPAFLSIQKYYDTSDIGTFPTRLKPISLRPPLTSLKKAINYNEIFEQLTQLSLSIYTPTHFILPSKMEKYAELYEDNKVNVGFTQANREQGIRRLTAINLMKRMESSVHSFNLTLKRIYSLIDSTIHSIDTYDKTSSVKLELTDISDIDEFDSEDQNGDELFTFGKKVKIDIGDMDYKSWRDSLAKDRDTLELLTLMVGDITPEYDSKLQELFRVIKNKLEHPINEGNKKIIIFTAFADTAQYLFDNVSEYVKENFGLNTAMVSGSVEGRTTVPKLKSDLNTVLTCFSPISKDKHLLIDKNAADTIEFYLISNGYVDMKRKVTDKYRTDVKMGTVAPLPEEIQPMAEGIHTLIQSIYDESVLKDMFTDGHETKVKDNPLNDNFAKAEFQALWKQINHKYAYTVEFDSDELIRKSIDHINEKLFVSELQYTTTIGRQKAEMNEHEVGRGASFTGEKTRTQTLKHAQTSQIKYDLIGKIAEGTVLTRKTVAAILKGLRADKLYMFKNNPEEFISKVIKLIKEQKATMIVEHISYDQIEGEYDSTIFTAEKSTQTFDKAFRATKAIQDYVFTDGSAEKSIERRFVEDLDAAQEVCVYAKLPKGFHIPTPVGNYSPDWAIAFYEGTVKHIFFVAETKGTMDSLNLRPIEQAKISCAKKLFNEMSTSNVKYHDVDSYQSLLNVMKSL